MRLKKKGKFSIVRVIKNTLDGLKVLWLQEKSFRIEVYLGLFLAPCLYAVAVSSIIKLLLILLWQLLLVVEVLNSALEAVVDRISLEHHPQSKIVKDMGSAAVGMVYLMNAAAWIYTIYGQ